RTSCKCQIISDKLGDGISYSVIDHVARLNTIVGRAKLACAAPDAVSRRQLQAYYLVREIVSRQQAPQIGRECDKYLRPTCGRSFGTMCFAQPFKQFSGARLGDLLGQLLVGGVGASWQPVLRFAQEGNARKELAGIRPKSLQPILEAEPGDANAI